ncbi:group 1 truncated hemoglobin [bacterium]|nr:group 1 truncated hemoglobin [bacterium]
MENRAQDTLYARLGGTEGITALVDDIVDQHMSNPAVSARFLPYKEKPELLSQIKKHTVDFFSMGSGGPAAYKGRDMETTHRGMNISEAEYMHVVDDIMAVCERREIDDQSKSEVLSIAWSLKEQIMHK